MDTTPGFELVLTCECCGHVEHRQAVDYDDCLRQYKDYHCPADCGPNLLSYIAMPKIKISKPVFFS
ncbi:hypothetical protein KAR48_07225 [bacterium]|nr:hypothetical protein [bacterium]